MRTINKTAKILSHYGGRKIMSKKLVGACIFGQSGGPTAVINASAYGVIKTALDADEITKVYGAANGFLAASMGAYGAPKSSSCCSTRRLPSLAPAATRSQTPRRTTPITSASLRYSRSTM